MKPYYPLVSTIPGGCNAHPWSMALYGVNYGIFRYKLWQFVRFVKKVQYEVKIIDKNLSCQTKFVPLHSKSRRSGNTTSSAQTWKIWTQRRL